MEVTKSVTSLYGFLLSPVCGDYPFWLLYSLLVGLPFLGVGLVYPEMFVTDYREQLPPTEGGHFHILHE